MVSAWHNKGINRKNGNVRGGSYCYEFVLLLEPENLDALQKGLCLEKLGTFDESLKCYDEVRLTIQATQRSGTIKDLYLIKLDNMMLQLKEDKALNRIQEFRLMKSENCSKS